LAEGGDIFLLEMGEPVPIDDLAENMIRLAGLRVRNEANPKGDIAISIIGRRPGETTHEELFYDPDRAQSFAPPAPSLLVMHSIPVLQPLQKRLKTKMKPQRVGYCLIWYLNGKMQKKPPGSSPSVPPAAARGAWF
jgi:FlaA1/EpsC-like NDP-sugar epimerase